MNKIEELIAKHCPTGVDFFTLGELGSFYGGLSGKSKKDFENGNSKYATYLNVYNNFALKTDITDLVFVGENEKQNAIQYGDVLFTGSSETPEECGFSSVMTTKTDEKIYLNSFCFGFRLNDVTLFDPNFLKHLFRSYDLRKQICKTASGVTRFNVSKTKMAKIKIPLPPMEVQREIVKILDLFTELITELKAELKARKKQYQYYRDHLLDFSSRPEVKFLKLGEVATILDGKRKPISKGSRSAGDYPYYGANGIQDYVSDYIFDGDYLLIGEDGSVIDENGRPIVNWASGKFWVNNHAHILGEKEGCLLRFLYYYAQTLDITTLVHGNIPKLTQGDLKSLPIPIPSLGQQEKIVGILDKFDALCNDLSAGLPREIELREKQYQYYRDKLLTFNQK